MKVMVGVGCDRDVAFATLSEGVLLGLQRVGLTERAVVGLATIDKKNDEAAVLALAEAKGWPLFFFDAAQLSRVTVPNPSETVRRYMGTPAVSEAAALLAAGVGVEGLILEKFKHRGADRKHATVSIALMKEN
ncbi:cobalamin biosynthesis protein [Ferrovum sp.]|jgi:cobalt-precorrin 5A hydrolase|uniref:cobalamin biosynthesis protein n=1 Tax=Ferrovum sp. TaxID=2609467 RepID=UPI002639B7F6|nr:cobalamin biosynthesis protein [Ferrovum sp.]